MWKEVKVRLAHGFGRVAQAKRLRLRPAVPDKAALRILKVDMVRHMVEQHLKQGICL